jgi:hypothetical protein
VLRASVLTWGSPAELVPSGATISQAQVVLRVRATQQDLVAPVLYGHTYTAQPSGSPSFAAGYGPLRFPRVGVGEQTVLTVPAAWVTAWLAGTITGFGLYSTDVVDGAYFQDRFDVVDGALVWRTTGNADLLITYSGGDAT